MHLQPELLYNNSKKIKDWKNQTIMLRRKVVFFIWFSNWENIFFFLDDKISELSIVKETTYLSLLRDVLIENKKLILGPGITL